MVGWGRGVIVDPGLIDTFFEKGLGELNILER